jgi:hypothetical protein
MVGGERPGGKLKLGRLLISLYPRGICLTLSSGFMKTSKYLFLILTVGVLALAGCSKSNKEASTARVPGRVDLTQLLQQFPSPTPEVTACLEKVRFACRYRTFDTAQAELDKLAQLPDLTEPQKKAVAEVVEQVKVALSQGVGKPTQ